MNTWLVVSCALAMITCGSLLYWSFRILGPRHPLIEDPRNEPMLSWLILLLAVVMIEWPLTAGIVLGATLAAIGIFGGGTLFTFFAIAVAGSAVTYLLCGHIENRRAKHQ